MASAPPPDEFLCPITLTLMKDPVICGDGHTYERDAIVRWLQSNTASPITRQQLSVQSIKPNFALRNAIQRYVNASQLPPVPPRPTAPQFPQPQQTVQVPIPSAPPGDHYFAMQVYQQEVAMQASQHAAQQLSNQSALRYGQVQANPNVAAQRKKIITACAILGAIIIFIIIISEIMNDE